MKNRWLTTLGLIGLGVMAFGIDAATAQTTANGPYYATPSWDQKLQCDTPATCPRFVVLANWNSAAVLDRETGLVWEKAPSTLNPGWVDASDHCLKLDLGGRGGWRLPTLQELRSLVDPTQSNPALPPGHPFTGQLNVYWSTTTAPAYGSDFAWLVFFGANGGAGPVSKSTVDGSLHAWCVRGGQAADAQ